MPRANIPPAVILPVLIITAILAMTRGAATLPHQPQTSHIAKLSGANQSDVFGYSADIEGTLLAAGIPHSDENGADSGAVQLFARDQGGPDAWGPVRLITDTATTNGDHLGIAVDIDQATLAVGAYFDDVSGKIDAGSAYIFYRDLGGPDHWGRVKQLSPSAAPESSLFGISLALQGDTLVIGAREDAGGAGSAYIFERNLGGADNWGLRKRLTAGAGMSGDQFGQDVAFSGDLILVGAPNHNSGTGAAYIFSRNLGGADNWGEVTQLLPDDLANPLSFGTSVGIEASSAAVGAPGTAAGGAFFIFEEDLGGPGSWGQRTRVETPLEDPDSGFGLSMSFSGDMLLIGARSGDGLSVDSGRAYLFERNTGGPEAWGLVSPFEASDGFTNDYYGFAVSLDGQNLAVGAHQDDDACPINPTCNSGSVYVYYLNSGTATPTPSPSASPSPTASPSPGPSLTPTASPTASATPNPDPIFLPLVKQDNGITSQHKRILRSP